jgi:hypothetical protein
VSVHQVGFNFKLKNDLAKQQCGNIVIYYCNISWSGYCENKGTKYIQQLAELARTPSNAYSSVSLLGASSYAFVYFFCSL